MTIITTQSRITYAGDGVSTSFPIPFEFFVNTDITAVKTAVGGGVTTLVQTVDYNLTGANTPAGGTALKTTPLLTGETMALFLNPPIEQESHYPANNPFPASTLENDLDRQTQISQRLNDILTRSLRAPDGDPSIATLGFLLPSASQRAGTALGFDANGNPTPIQTIPAGTLSAATIGALIGAQTAAEGATGVAIVFPWYPPGNMLRYGILPNNTGAATSNTTILKTLFNPAIGSGPTGQFTFPNTTGADVYSFNGTCPIRDGVHIDLNKCTINFIGSTNANDANCGLFYALRDFTLENGSINTAVNTTLGSQGGAAIAIGARGVGFYFTVFDSLLPVPMGNITLRNLRIDANNSVAPLNSNEAISMLGGLVNVVVENIVVNCHNLGILEGIAYEWGWATNPPGTITSQTSHGHNMRFTNIKIYNSNEIAMALIGCYNCEVTGLKTINCQRAFDYDPGEALFTVPWVGVDDVGAKRTMKLSDIVAEGCTSTAVVLSGAKTAAGTYQAGFGRTAAQQTDLMTFTLDGFSLQSTGGCLLITGDATVTNGKLDGQNAGVDVLAVTNDALRTTFSNVKALNGGATGNCLRANITGTGLWSPERNKFLTFTDGQLAGGLVGANMGNIAGAVLARNLIGYSALYDGVGNETVMTTGVQCGAGVTGVTCDSNFSTPAGGGVSYVVVGSPTDRVGNNLVNPLGNSTTSGSWDLQGSAQATNGNFLSKTSSVNTVGKFAGRQATNTSSNRTFIAQGSLNTSVWISTDASTTLTPV